MISEREQFVQSTTTKLAGFYRQLLQKYPAENNTFNPNKAAQIVHDLDEQIWNQYHDEFAKYTQIMRNQCNKHIQAILQKFPMDGPLSPEKAPEYREMMIEGLNELISFRNNTPRLTEKDVARLNTLIQNIEYIRDNVVDDQMILETYGKNFKHVFAKIKEYSIPSDKVLTYMYQYIPKMQEFKNQHSDNEKVRKHIDDAVNQITTYAKAQHIGNDVMLFYQRTFLVIKKQITALEQQKQQMQRQAQIQQPPSAPPPPPPPITTPPPMMQKTPPPPQNHQFQQMRYPMQQTAKPQPIPPTLAAKQKRPFNPTEIIKDIFTKVRGEIAVYYYTPHVSTL